MNKKLTEKFRVDAIKVNSTSSSLVSRWFDMKGFNKAAVIMTQGTQVSTVAQPWKAFVVPCGATETVTTASTGITGSTIDFGTSTIGTMRGVQEFCIRISATAALATVPTVIINNTTYTGGTVADTTEIKFLGSTTVIDGKAMLLSLATMIQAHNTELETTWSTVMATAGEGGVITCRVKDYLEPGYSKGATCITTAAIASAAEQNELYAYPALGQAVINFSMDDIAAANSTATGFRVVITTTAASASANPISGVLIREANDYTPTQALIDVSTF